MQTVKFKAQLTNVIFATVNQMFSSSTQLLGKIIEHSLDNKAVLSSSWKLGGAAEHLIEGSEKRICWLRFELSSPHVIERRNKGQCSYST